MIIRIVTLLLICINLIVGHPYNHFKYFGSKYLPHSISDENVNKVSRNSDIRSILVERAAVLSPSDLEKLILQEAEDSYRRRRQADYEDYEDDLKPSEDAGKGKHITEDDSNERRNKNIDVVTRPAPKVALRRFSPTTHRPRSYQKTGLKEVKEFIIRNPPRQRWTPRKTETSTIKQKKAQPKQEENNEEQGVASRQRFGGIPKQRRSTTEKYEESENGEATDQRPRSVERRNKKDRPKTEYSEEGYGNAGNVEDEHVQRRRLKPSQTNQQDAGSSRRKTVGNKAKEIYDEDVLTARKVPDDTKGKDKVIYKGDKSESTSPSSSQRTTSQTASEEDDSSSLPTEVSERKAETTEMPKPHSKRAEASRSLEDYEHSFIPAEEEVYDEEETHSIEERDVASTTASEEITDEYQGASSKMYSITSIPSRNFRQSYQESTESEYSDENYESTSTEDLLTTIPEQQPILDSTEVVIGSEENEDVLVKESIDGFMSTIASEEEETTIMLQTQPTTYRPKRIHRPQTSTRSEVKHNVKKSEEGYIPETTEINREPATAVDYNKRKSVTHVKKQITDEYTKNVAELSKTVQPSSKSNTQKPRSSNVRSETRKVDIYEETTSEEQVPTTENVADTDYPVPTAYRPKASHTKSDAPKAKIENNTARKTVKEIATRNSEHQQIYDETLATTYRPQRVNKKKTIPTTTTEFAETEKSQITETSPVRRPITKNQSKISNTVPTQKPRNVPNRTRKIPSTTRPSTTTTTTTTTEKPTKLLSEEEYEYTIGDIIQENDEAESDEDKRESEERKKNQPFGSSSTQRPKGRRISDVSHRQKTASSTKKPTKIDDEFKRQAEGAHYSFGSQVDDTITGAHNTREETRDGVNVKGKYSYNDGYFQITVHYEADDKGFRILKQEKIPIGDGPEFNPEGEAMIYAHKDGKEVKYKVTEAELERDKVKSKTNRRVHLRNPQGVRKAPVHQEVISQRPSKRIHKVPVPVPISEEEE